MESIRRYNALISVIVATVALSWQAWMIWDGVNRRFDALDMRIQKSLDHVWSVDMQHYWALQIATENTNNWIANPYSIWQAVKEGKVPARLRLTVSHGKQYE